MNHCGNETEGVDAAHEGAANVTTPTTAVAFGKRGEEDGLPTTRVQPVEGVVDALRQMQEKQNTEAEARAFVRALLSDEGESYVQSVLQSEIQKVKRKESELATVKKKVTAANKEVDELQGDIRRAIETKAEAERICKFLQTAMKQRARLTEEAKKEMEEHRESVKQKVEQNVHDIRVKCDERKKNVAELIAENERLREEVRQKKKQFDEAYESHQSNWKARESYLEELMRSFQQVTREVGMLEEQLALTRRERLATEEGVMGLRRQLDMYSTQLRDFSEGYSVEDAEKSAAQQREQAEARIAQLEAEKKEANELRLKFDKELAGWRTALAAAKRELQKAEKARMAAEKQCRLIQEKSRLKTKP
ncbi:hypothetical protein TraAM80_07460 [Trypanosoma rangeli]|uniref:Uncharacterized protein n=1 Tax=Trypanosoma rangeli TaxID=5698 RepID=A0A3R7M749_TRYRA|nr:uncharacterized protein TraAM80_07460 [Trypanosoma rangeli]RNF00686.1 hypothetical protein TraAM80_07460 [Trypanosoma rangeli]|eukprot:RNF00686.1 hypothetical protein TraAM80_07460 [Trypanosoma rangeli]